MEQWLLWGGAVMFCAFMLAALWPRGRAPSYFSFAGIMLVAAALGLRWYSLGRPPWAALYETTAILALVTGIAAAYCYRRKETPALYMPLAAVTVLLPGFSALSWETGTALSPALNSGWLLVHVPVVILSYGMFAISCGASSAFIALKVTKKGDQSTFKRLDSISYAFIAAGLALLVPGIAMGALWANAAWGSYWSWDPKETWSLITAAIYLIYLIARKAGMKPEDAAFLSTLGFISVLFTYLGVSYLIPGLHSYA
jgi:cytochrome c-type biogenesis protein CcsB